MLGADIPGNAIFAEDGTKVAIASATESTVPLPPGKYTIDDAGQKVPIDPAAHQKVEIRAR